MRPDLNHDPLTERLVDTADAMPVPDVPITQDIARGRRRRHRRRLAMSGTALATAAIVGAGAIYGLGSTGDDAATPQESRYAGGDRTPSGPEVTPPVEDEQTELPLVDAKPDGPRPPKITPATEAEQQRQLANRQEIARIVDPEGKHISKEQIEEVDREGVPAGFDDLRIHEKLGWTNPGEDGLGLVQYSLGTTPEFDCGAHPAPGDESQIERCDTVDLGGLEVTEVTVPGQDSPSYAYERSDGFDVTVTVDPLWGQNSSDPVGEVAVSDAQLAELLRSTAITLAEDADPDPEPLVAGEKLRDAARTGITDVQLVKESWAGQNGGYYNASVESGGSVVGELVVDEGSGNLAMDAPCPDWYATRCVTGQADGSPYRIDYRRNEQGGGFDVTVEGPERTIWAYFGPTRASKDGYPVTPEDLIALAGDPALQE